MENEEFEKLKDIQYLSESELLEKENVVGVGIGKKQVAGRDVDEIVISVYVSKKLKRIKKSEKVPIEIGFAKTDVIETGEFFTQEIKSQLTDFEKSIIKFTNPKTSLIQRTRPTRPGFSIGHQSGGAGTICCVCRNWGFEHLPDQFYLMSNNHVLADLNRAKKGDKIYQPAPLDGGMASDVIGTLHDFVPIKFISGSSKPINYHDIAIAKCNLSDIDGVIYGFGGAQIVPSEWDKKNIADSIRKAGRTTGCTDSSVSGLNATIDVNYSNGRKARFGKIIMAYRFSNPGDSGSLVLGRWKQPYGILFAGSENRTLMTPFWSAGLEMKVHMVI